MIETGNSVYVAIGSTVSIAAGRAAADTSSALTRESIANSHHAQAVALDALGGGIGASTARTEPAQQVSARGRETRAFGRS